MKKPYPLFNIVLFLGLTCYLCGCVNTSVIPLGSRTFSVFATAATKALAYNTVAAKAVAICRRKDKVDVINTEIKYRGIDYQQLELIQQANQVFPQTQGKTYKPSDLNYLARLTFRCSK